MIYHSMWVEHTYNPHRNNLALSRTETRSFMQRKALISDRLYFMKTMNTRVDI